MNLTFSDIFRIKEAFPHCAHCTKEILTVWIYKPDWNDSVTGYFRCIEHLQKETLFAGNKHSYYQLNTQEMFVFNIC